MELFSPGHLVILAIVVAVLFFGWKQLPDMARSLGRSLRIFKTEMKGMSEDDKKRSETRDAAMPPPALEAKETTAAPPAAVSPAVPPVPAVPPAASETSEPVRETQPVTKPFE